MMVDDPGGALALHSEFSVTFLADCGDRKLLLAECGNRKLYLLLGRWYEEYLEHTRRTLQREVKPPYDGSERRRRYWKKVEER
jgi:hypothetical protein